MTTGYKGDTRGYCRLLSVTIGYKGLKGLQRVTGGYKN